MSNLGKNLNDSVRSYNDLLNSTESRLLVSARRFKELKVTSDSEIAESRSVETIAAFPSAPELEFDKLLPDAAQKGKVIDKF
jgi:DNA recombination protein RmuC